MRLRRGGQKPGRERRGAIRARGCGSTSLGRQGCDMKVAEKAAMGTAWAVTVAVGCTLLAALPEPQWGVQRGGTRALLFGVLMTCVYAIGYQAYKHQAPGGAWSSAPGARSYWPALKVAVIEQCIVGILAGSVHRGSSSARFTHFGRHRLREVWIPPDPDRRDDCRDGLLDLARPMVAASTAGLASPTLPLVPRVRLDQVAFRLRQNGNFSGHRAGGPFP